MYSNCCCRCSFEPEIIKVGQSSHKMYSNNILSFQEIGITVTFMYHHFFSLSSKVQIFISLSAFFLFYSVACQYGKVHHSAGSFLFSLSQVVWSRLGDPFESQNPREVCAFRSPGRIPGCAYTTCSCGQIKTSCTIPNGSPSPLNFILFLL